MELKPELRSRRTSCTKVILIKETCDVLGCLDFIVAYRDRPFKGDPEAKISIVKW